MRLREFLSFVQFSLKMLIYNTAEVVTKTYLHKSINHVRSVINVTLFWFIPSMTNLVLLESEEWLHVKG